MASLQEQLLKAGLADKKKAADVKREKRKQNKLKNKSKIVEVDENKVAAKAALEAKKAKDRELNAKAKLEAEQKAIAAQIKQLIDTNKQRKNDGDVFCNFVDGTLVKRLRVSDATNRHISQGKLAIVRFSEGYEIVPMPVADKIAERDPDVVVHRASNEEQAASASDEDDWYADYDIPDDLTW